jgi:tetratricopeptide (TPR) repeat protein
MASRPLRADEGRHPWLTEFKRSPKAAFGDLLAGFARIHPYERADASDAVRMLFGPLPADDPARQELGPAILEWLKERRREPLPADPHRLQRFVREVCEAFEIVSLLPVPHAAVELRRGFVIWNEWVARLVLSPSRDARAEYWRMLALTQPLVAENSSIEPHGLTPFWLQVCTQSGGRLEFRYLTIGLLGLRRLPGAPLDGTEAPWLAGLAQWALARKPSNDAFLAEWRPLKGLYPATPALWRERVATVLGAKPFKDAGIKAPEWWTADPDFQARLLTGHVVRRTRGEASLSPVPRKDWKLVVEAIERGEPLPKLRPRVDQIAHRQRQYAEGTGDPYFLVRMFTNFGMKLIEHGTDARAERAQIAQALAQEALQWEPHNVFAWSLWRDALVEQGAFEAAELVGWEFIRRIPHDPQPRNQLAELLIATDRVPEAEAVLDEAFATETFDVVTYVIKARLLSHAGDIEAAQRAVAEGLKIDDRNAVLRDFRSRLKAGKELRLVSAPFRETQERSPGAASMLEPSADPSLAWALARGRARRLRSQLDSANEELRAKARTEVQRWLQEDPTFAYAELLAARERMWRANTSTLSPIAVAFEEALSSEDRDRLESLAERMPRLAALILVARAVLGDAEAAGEVERWLRAGPDRDEEPAVAALRELMRPVLRVIEGGKSAAQAIAENRAAVLHALRDANEATLGDALLVA